MYNQLHQDTVNQIAQAAVNAFGKELARQGEAQFKVDQILAGFASNQQRLLELGNRINNAFTQVQRQSLALSDQEKLVQTANLVVYTLLEEYKAHAAAKQQQFHVGLESPQNQTTGVRYTVTSNGTGTVQQPENVIPQPVVLSQETKPTPFIGITSIGSKEEYSTMSVNVTELEHTSSHQYQLNDDLTLHIHSFKTDQAFNTYTDAIRALYATMTRRHLASPDLWGFTMKYRKLTELPIPYATWEALIKEIKAATLATRVMPVPTDMAYMAQTKLSAAEYKAFCDFIGQQASKFFPILVEGISKNPIRRVESLEDLVTILDSASSIEYKAFIETVWDQLEKRLFGLDYVINESEHMEAGIITEDDHEGDHETVVKEVISVKTVFWETVTVSVSNITDGTPPMSLKQFGMGKDSNVGHPEILNMIKSDVYVPVKRRTDLIEQNLKLYRPRIAAASSRIDSDNISTSTLGIFGWI